MEEGDEAIAAEAVEDAESAFLGGDEAGAAEDGEVFGDGGQVGTGEVAQVAHAFLALVERFDDAEAGGVSEGFDGLQAGLAGGGHGGCGRGFGWTVTGGRWGRKGFRM